MNAVFAGAKLKGKTMTATGLSMASNHAETIAPAAARVINTTRRLARFETAQELCGMMAAGSSSLIRDEEAKAHPDPVVVGRLRLERAAYLDEGSALRLDDSAAIERAIAAYGPVIRAGGRA